MVPQQVAIVGAGQGGLRSAEGLRAGGYEGRIVVVGDEPHAPYNRPPLSKEALAQGATHEALAFRQRAAVADVCWNLGIGVARIDVDARIAALSDGSQLSFDGLVVATGVSARRLAVPGPGAQRSAGRHVVRTLDDAANLRPELAAGTRVVVLGAGFIGCEVAATARGLGCDVTCVALDGRPMIRPLGPVLAKELQARHERRGVRFHLGVAVERLLGEQRVEGVALADGTRIDADVVVEAIGSSCNVGPLAGQGFDLSDGVLCDTALRPVRHGAGVDGIAVVGDIARFPNTRFDIRAHRVEHWNIPTDTGRRAGAVLSSYLRGFGYAEVVARQWQVLPSFWSDQYDIRLQSYGMPSLADLDGIRVLDGDLGEECVVGYHRDGHLIGVIALGMTRAVATYRDLVGRV